MSGLRRFWWPTLHAPLVEAHLGHPWQCQLRGGSECSASAAVEGPVGARRGAVMALESYLKPSLRGHPGQEARCTELKYDPRVRSVKWDAGV